MRGFAVPGFRAGAMTGVAAIAMVAAPAHAQTRSFDLAAQPAATGLPAFAKQAGIEIVADGNSVREKRTNAVHGTMTVAAALQRLLAGTGLAVSDDRTQTGVVIIRAAPQAEAEQNDPGPDIIVTAQKREEKIQDVPIAISVFTAKTLDEQKIEGGSELLRGTPNVSFSKTNFASYNFQIRGIGTQALSVTTDPAVAISFNSMPLVRNRLFEQEYFDVDRIEVLRGPQGTLYGRNATAGVVNMIPNLATPDRLKADFKVETGNYGSMRASGMLNVPLGDTLAVRVAGAFTKRDGYDFNTATNRRVNGRDLWGGRASITWKPSSAFKASLVWEHFSENDSRSRTGKQLCHNDPSPTRIGAAPVTTPNGGFFSQGCKAGSLYDDAAFGIPNGASLPNVIAGSSGPGGGVGLLLDADGNYAGFATAIPFGTDPFAGAVQSRNLREIATSYDPKFRAKNDVAQLNLEFEINNGLKLVSQTGWTRDNYYSTQDYARFQSRPIFTDTSLGNLFWFGPNGPEPTYNLLPGGAFCDPQLGCSKGYLAVDLNRAKSRQWSQEFRLQSSFDGPLNFNLGVNYLDFKIDEDYFVFNNTFTLVGVNYLNREAGGAGSVPVYCPPGKNQPDPGSLGATCLYIDPNPIDKINGDGHNYFRSRNVARTKSWAGFGELYWQVSDALKVTAGLRYTRDIKITTPYPTQTLLTPGLYGGGYVNSGYPALPDIKQKWGEVTGRLVVDWKPDLSFTDDSLLYASYARGYKAGGTNSPGIGSDPQFLGFFQTDPRFKPEFVNAFEIGSKNSFANGKVQLNATAFFYDYKDYQVSQIIDRATKNENYDAQTWGLELETIWRTTPRLRFNANLGLLRTKIGKGERSIDVMNRTQGHDDWVVVKPWLQQASNCIAPKALVEKFAQILYDDPFSRDLVNLSISGFCPFPSKALNLGFPAGNPYGDFVYDPLTYRDVGQNQGRGFYDDLSGHELPNAPHWTANIGAQYTIPMNAWSLTVRGDYYRQGKSWARVYNAVNDRLRSWGNANLAVTLERPESGLTFQLYVKNLLDDTPITGAFINSDDSGLTTNVFTLDPRIIGFSMAKKF
ncbi:TonB-dependent receptor domain-containing protein [Sphingomonas sp. ERG5]|uniref:TonB-dependent receptor domain-containing protein n=1 Tax=Sphingomonas sp. ERG5 TaxID=1381597 RepID=UPI0009DE2E76|nr:TonB-dependent receptor [Sphingomonas sp. ERG5]